MVNGEKITFATTCYEKDIDKVTSPEYAKKLFRVGNDCIDYRILTVGNVSDKNSARKKCEALKELGIIDDFFFSYDYYKKLKRQFKGCSRLSFLRRKKIRLIIWEILYQRKFKPFYDGINYSVSPMTACLVCPTKWLFYITEDVEIHSEKTEEWLSKSIDVMNNNDKVITATVIRADKDSTNEKEKVHRDWSVEEAVSEDNDFWYSEIFSDQCFLIDTDRVRKTREIFGEENDFCKKKYPIYGSNDFEQRLGAYIRNHKLLRATYKDDYYVHLKHWD